MKTYYENPTQVAFYDSGSKRYLGAIGYGDSLICLCCGMIIDIEDYLEGARVNFPHIKYPIIELSWADISDSCIGDAMFDSDTGEIVM